MPFHDRSIEWIVEIVAFYQLDLPQSERTGIEILLRVHNRIWEDKSRSHKERLESCDLLFELAMGLFGK